MARRFGRNQRRQMREEIATKNELLSEALNRSAARGREVDMLRGRLEQWAGEVVHLMGRDSAFNERVAKMTVNDRYMDRLRLRPIEFVPLGRGPDRMPVATVETIITALIWRLRMSRDEFQHMIRIELEARDATPVGYALPIEHHWTRRDQEYLARRIAAEMVDVLNGVDKDRRRA
jgi:hypothetical protein